MTKRTLAPALLLLILTPFLAPTFAGPPETPEEAIAEADRLVSAGEFENALGLLRETLDAHPGHPGLLLGLGKAAYAQALDSLYGSNASLGRLGLIDAMRWLERAAAAAPDDAEAFALLGECSVAAGEFGKAAAAWARVAELRPGDGEALYQLGYALGYAGRFAEAVAAFGKAEAILGPDPRVLLNRGICHESLGDGPEAVRWFVRVIDGEAAAGRPGSEQAQGAWNHLWAVLSKAGNWAEGVKVYASLAEGHPELVGVHWYLAHARREDGDLEGAEAAFAKVAELAPAWAEGWLRLGEARVALGDYPAAEVALDRLVPLDPEGEGTRDLLLSIARGLARARKPEEAEALIETRLEAFGNDVFVVEALADLSLVAGEAGRAVALYRRAAELDPFSDALPVKEQKAVSALLRRGLSPEDLGELRIPGEPRSPGEGGVIYDFEGSRVFVRPAGVVEGSREEGAYRLRRQADVPPVPEGAMRNFGPYGTLTLDLIPTLDSRTFDALAFRAKGEAGKAFLVRMRDRFDEFRLDGYYTRILYPEPVVLTGDWQEVSLPLDGFVSVFEQRPLPLDRARLRTVAFEIVADLGTGSDLAGEVWIDDVALTAQDGRTLVLEDFEGKPEETLFLSAGIAEAFIPALSRPEQVADARPDPNCYVAPAILGDEYDRSMVHGGAGAFRLTLPRPGDAWGALTFNPDRSFDRAAAITFAARGEKGGERLRVAFLDSLDADLEGAAPASAPRVTLAGRLVEGWFLLTEEWQVFRIPREDLPDVHFDSLTELRFLFGTPEGNAPGTRIWLDDIRWE